MSTPRRRGSDVGRTVTRARTLAVAAAKGRDAPGRNPGSAAARRPLTRLTVVSLAGHLAFELGAGVGVPLASVLGPYPAAGVWTLATGAVWRAAAVGHASADRFLAAVNGFGLAAVTAHLTGWPTRRTRTGLPWLRECEGLGPNMMPYYNSVLYFSAATALLATARENPKAPLRLPLAMLALVPGLVAFQHWEHQRLVRQAQIRPRWWNRRRSRAEDLDLATVPRASTQTAGRWK